MDHPIEKPTLKRRQLLRSAMSSASAVLAAPLAQASNLDPTKQQGASASVLGARSPDIEISRKPAFGVV